VSFKTTAVLAGILVILVAFAYFFRGERPPDPEALGPEVWSIEEEDIEHIRIISGDEVSFVRDPDSSWRFDDAERSPIDTKRWGGIPLLVSGPASKRVIAEKAQSLAEYGLDSPSMRILLGVRDRGTLEVQVGDETPDGGSVYVKLKDWDRVYTVDRSWFEVLQRLATEPPKVSAAPAPSVEKQ
jgi:hypothetical protein